MSIALVHSPADILRWVLIQIGQGTDPAQSHSWPVFTAGEPPSPDEVLTVYDTSPQSDGRSMIDGEQFLHYGVQVRLRSTTHQVGFAKANAVRNALDKGVYEVVVNLDSNQYLVYCVAKTNLLCLGKETPTSKRTLFTINGTLTIRAL